MQNSTGATEPINRRHIMDKNSYMTDFETGQISIGHCNCDYDIETGQSAKGLH